MIRVLLLCMALSLILRQIDNTYSFSHIKKMHTSTYHIINQFWFSVEAWTTVAQQNRSEIYKMQSLSTCVLQTSIWNANGNCSMTIELLVNIGFIKSWYFLSESLKEHVFNSLRISEKNESAELSDVSMISGNSGEISWY